MGVLLVSGRHELMAPPAGILDKLHSTPSASGHRSKVWDSSSKGE